MFGIVLDLQKSCKDSRVIIFPSPISLIVHLLKLKFNICILLLLNYRLYLDFIKLSNNILILLQDLSQDTTLHLVYYFSKEKNPPELIKRWQQQHKTS